MHFNKCPEIASANLLLVVCHVVRQLGTPLSDFPSHECAKLLADVFCAGKAHVRNAYLTLLGTDSMGFAITPEMRQNEITKRCKFAFGIRFRICKRCDSLTDLLRAFPIEMVMWNIVRIEA